MVLLRKFRVRLSVVGVMLAYMLVSVPFILWDIWAAQSGHWGFNPSYTLGYEWFGIAFEEVLFFFTVPLACLVIFLALGVRGKLARPGVAQLAISLLLIAGLLMSSLWVEQGYTRSVGIALIIACVLLLLEGRLVYRRRFWVFQVILFLLFIAANTFLTGLPVITYGSAHFIGFRLGTIPLEDFAYNFALINTFLLVYTRSIKQATK